MEKKGFPCHQCTKFYEGEPNTNTCRHKEKPPSTPPDFWRTDFPDSEEIIARKLMYTDDDLLPDSAKPRWMRKKEEKERAKLAESKANKSPVSTSGKMTNDKETIRKDESFGSKSDSSVSTDNTNIDEETVSPPSKKSFYLTDEQQIPVSTVLATDTSSSSAGGSSHSQSQEKQSISETSAGTSNNLSVEKDNTPVTQLEPIATVTYDCVVDGNTIMIIKDASSRAIDDTGPDVIIEELSPVEEQFEGYDYMTYSQEQNNVASQLHGYQSNVSANIQGKKQTSSYQKVSPVKVVVGDSPDAKKQSGKQGRKRISKEGINLNRRQCMGAAQSLQKISETAAKYSSFHMQSHPSVKLQSKVTAAKSAQKNDLKRRLRKSLQKVKDGVVVLSDDSESEDVVELLSSDDESDVIYSISPDGNKDNITMENVTHADKCLGEKSLESVVDSDIIITSTVSENICATTDTTIPAVTVTTDPPDNIHNQVSEKRIDNDIQVPVAPDNLACSQFEHPITIVTEKIVSSNPGKDTVTSHNKSLDESASYSRNSQNIDLAPSPSQQGSFVSKATDLPPDCPQSIKTASFVIKNTNISKSTNSPEKNFDTDHNKPFIAFQTRSEEKKDEMSDKELHASQTIVLYGDDSEQMKVLSEKESNNIASVSNEENCPQIHGEDINTLLHITETKPVNKEEADSNMTLKQQQEVKPGVKLTNAGKKKVQIQNKIINKPKAKRYHLGTAAFLNEFAIESKCETPTKKSKTLVKSREAEKNNFAVTLNIDETKANKLNNKVAISLANLASSSLKEHEETVVSNVEEPYVTAGNEVSNSEMFANDIPMTVQSQDVSYSFVEYNFSKPKEMAYSIKEFSTSCENYLRGCLWSPDGKSILTNNDDNIIRLFVPPDDLFEEKDIPSKELLATLRMSEGETVYGMDWYPYMDSNDADTCCFLTTSRDHPVHLWDACTGRVRCSYRAFNHMDELTSANCVSFNLDGSKIYCGFNKVVRVFDSSRPGREFTEIHTVAKKQRKKGKHRHALNLNQSGIISSIAFSSEYSGLLAMGSFSKTVGLYTAHDHKLLHLLNDDVGGHTGGVTQVKFSADGGYLFSGGRKDSEIICWDMRNTTMPLFKLLREVKTNQRVQFDVDKSGSYLVSGGTDNLINVYDLNPIFNNISDEVITHNPTERFHAHHDAVNSVSLHPTKPILASTSGQRHFIVDEASDSDSMDSSETPSVTSICFDNSLRLWKI